MQEVNWIKLRNAIRKRLRHHVEPQELDDATQDACGFAFVAISEGVDVGLAIWRAAARARKGHTFTYEPAQRERWEQPDYESTEWYLRNRPGVGQHSIECTRPLPRFVPIQTLRRGCHQR